MIWGLVGFRKIRVWKPSAQKHKAFPGSGAVPGLSRATARLLQDGEVHVGFRVCLRVYPGLSNPGGAVLSGYLSVVP